MQELKDQSTCVPGSKLPLFPYNRGMVINPIVGVYIPIIRIPIKGGMTIPQKKRLLTMAHVFSSENLLPASVMWVFLLQMVVGCHRKNGSITTEEFQ